MASRSGKMQGKSKITGMLPKSFKPKKCKTSLKLAASRIKLLKNKKDAALKQMRRDLAQLLETGQEQTARIRVEHVIREEKTVSAYELIEIYCEIIDSRLPIIESQKNCPIDLKEAITSVIFASPRCADIPELTDVRKHFTAKYGKEFVKAVLEIRPDCGVSRMLVEKLSANPPDIQTKMKVLNEVAKEHNIKWESKVFEEQLQKPKDDLLSGPSSFSNIEKISVKSSDVQPSFVSSWNSESTTKISQQNVTSSSQEAKSTYSREENEPVPRSNWKMEFKDATSAAEAAAESAERASMAARAAAELASRGNISGQSSGGLYDSSPYVGKSEGVEFTKSSNLERNHTSRASAPAEDEKRKGSYSEEPKMQNLRKDDIVQSSKSTKNDTFHSTSTRENVMSEEPQFSDFSDDDMASDVDLHEDSSRPNNYAQKNFSVPDPAAKNSKNDNDDSYDPRYSKNENSEKYDTRHEILSSSSYSYAFDEYTSNDDQENGTKVQSYGAHYDNYDSDTDAHYLTERHNEVNLLDSFLPQSKEESSVLSANMSSWSPKVQTAVSLRKESSSQLHHFSEPHQIDSSETREKANVHSDSDDEPLPPKFDSPKFDSEGPGSESEDEVEKSNIVESARPSSSPHTDNSPRKGLLSNQPKMSSSSTVLPVVVDNLEIEPNSSEKNWRSGLSVRHSQQNQRSARSPRGGGMTEEEQPAFNVTSDEGYDDGVLKFGRLTGGLRNRAYTRPPYVRNTNNDASPKSVINSEDTSLSIEKEISVEKSGFSTSVDTTSEEKPSKDLNINSSRPKVRALRANVDTNFESEGQIPKNNVEDGGSEFRGSLTSLNRSSDYSSAVRGRSASSQYRAPSEGVEDPVQAYLERRKRKESILRSSFTNTDVYSKEEDTISTPKSQKPDVSTFTEKSTVYRINKMPSDPEVPDQGPYSQKPSARKYSDTSSRMPIDYSGSDGNGAGSPVAQPTSMRGGSNVVRVSRRTRASPSIAKEDELPTSLDQSVVSPVKESESSLTNSASGPYSSKTRYTRYLDNTESFKPKQSYSLAEEPSVRNLQTESSTKSPKLSQVESRQSSTNEKDEKLATGTSSEKSTSRESSFKSTSHVHPKLPDIDSITAHFQSLRANVRPK